jgi:hypothetical protein
MTLSLEVVAVATVSMVTGWLVGRLWPKSKAPGAKAGARGLVKLCTKCRTESVIDFLPESGKPAPRPFCYRCGHEPIQ